MRSHSAIIAIVFATLLLCYGAIHTPPSFAQAVAPVVPAASAKPNVANDPDVLAAQRLFSVWIEGQLAYRGLPGVSVGVVSDQQLVWSKGFGFADVKSKLPMTAATKFRIASHSELKGPGSIIFSR
jgi:D-alanyl-D-alanine carboxypeptidase